MPPEPISSVILYGPSFLSIKPISGLERRRPLRGGWSGRSFSQIHSIGSTIVRPQFAPRRDLGRSRAKLRGLGIGPHAVHMADEALRRKRAGSAAIADARRGDDVVGIRRARAVDLDIQVHGAAWSSANGEHLYEESTVCHTPAHSAGTGLLSALRMSRKVTRGSAWTDAAQTRDRARATTV